jgi:GlcNAc-P-P-Und epimerase
VKTCLVTGASGFIGSHLIEHIRRTGAYDCIYMLDRVRPAVVSEADRFLSVDIRAPFTLDLPDHCKTCFHLAAVCKEPGYAWDEYYKANYEGTRNLSRAVERTSIREIIFTSTMMVYRAGEACMTESSTTCPDTAYGISKLLAEEVLRGWVSADEGRQLKILRPGIVFGRGENGNFTRLYRALRGRYFFYIGRRSTIKGTIYVKDLVRCLDFLRADANSECLYNAVFPRPYTIEDIAKAIQKTCGFRGTPPVVPFRPAVLAARAAEALVAFGIHTPIHHRRIEKLYYSTHLSAQKLCHAGFQFEFDLLSALEDWMRSSPTNALC